MRKIVVTEAFAGKNSNVSPLSLLKITDAFFGLALHFKNCFSYFIQNFTGVGQHQLFTHKIDKSDVIIRLQALDAFCHRRLGDVKLIGCRAEVAVFGGEIKDFELVEVHLR